MLPSTDTTQLPTADELRAYNARVDAAMASLIALANTVTEHVARMKVRSPTIPCTLIPNPHYEGPTDER
jgi:hypothetical protein